MKKNGMEDLTQQRNLQNAITALRVSQAPVLQIKGIECAGVETRLMLMMH